MQHNKVRCGGVVHASKPSSWKVKTWGSHVRGYMKTLSQNKRERKKNKPIASFKMAGVD